MHTRLRRMLLLLLFPPAAQAVASPYKSLLMHLPASGIILWARFFVNHSAIFNQLTDRMKKQGMTGQGSAAQSRRLEKKKGSNRHRL